MSFNVPAEAYDAFMGRFSEPLAVEFVAFAGLEPSEDGLELLDVGCGPGALTEQLVHLSGAGSVHAVDPSDSFVAALGARFPDVDVRRAAAEQLPFDDDTFDAVLAQLVVHFMADPVGGLREMGRVCRPGGVVAACVWDHADGGGPLSGYWSAVRDLDPAADDESDLAGAREGDLAKLAAEAGLRDVQVGVVGVTVDFASFEEWWEPYTFGIGPAGQYVAGLDASRRQELKERCLTKFPTAPFSIRASAWAVRARPPVR